VTGILSWWEQPRRVSVVVDNDSWVTPYCQELVRQISTNGDDACFVGPGETVSEGDVAFYFGCIKITPPEVLTRHRRNLVAHASNLPDGKGFSPLTWQIIEGHNEIPICLIEATGEVDAGPVIYRDVVNFNGHELLPELQAKLGQAQVDLALRFLAEAHPPDGQQQSRGGSIYPRRNPSNSELDVDIPISEQFDLLRTVDNNRYPAFFDLRGHRYKLTIEKMDEDET